MQIVRGRAPETTPTQSRTETFTGTVWGDPVLPTTAEGVRGAITNGATVQEIQETLLQAAVYCGVPAALESFRVAESALGQIAGETGDG